MSPGERQQAITIVRVSPGHDCWGAADEVGNKKSMVVRKGSVGRLVDARDGRLVKSEVDGIVAIPGGWQGARCRP